MGITSSWVLRSSPPRGSILGRAGAAVAAAATQQQQQQLLMLMPQGGDGQLRVPLGARSTAERRTRPGTGAGASLAQGRGRTETVHGQSCSCGEGGLGPRSRRARRRRSPPLASVLIRDWSKCRFGMEEGHLHPAARPAWGRGEAQLRAGGARPPPCTRGRLARL